MGRTLVWVVVLVGAVAGGLALSSWFESSERRSRPTTPSTAALETEGDGVRRLISLPAGTFFMGDADNAPSAAARHQVELAEFRLGCHEVTNGAFAEFVAATGYRTTAERSGFGRVGAVGRNEFREIAGADWRHPDGPDSDITARSRWPVVQVSWHDALAYCRYRGGRLPTEAEWEYAARGGRLDQLFPWGQDFPREGEARANYATEILGARDEPADGFRRQAPVGSFAANPFGLFDLGGNVREWCHDWYAPDYYSVAPRRDPSGPNRGTQRVVRGGGWLSPLETLRVAHRESLPPDWSDNMTGFRLRLPEESR